MRKMYIQPKNEISKVKPQSIICTSSQFGGNTSELGEGDHNTDAPKRRTKVF